MLWEHEPQASVSTAFSSSPKLSRVVKPRIVKPRVVKFTSCETFTQCTRRLNLNCSVFLSSYRNRIINQSARVFSLSYFLIKFTAEMSSPGATFLNTVVYNGKRFQNQ